MKTKRQRQKRSSRKILQNACQDAGGDVSIMGDINVWIAHNRMGYKTEMDNWEKQR